MPRAQPRERWYRVCPVAREGNLTWTQLQLVIGDKMPSVQQQDLLLKPPAPASLSEKDGFTYVGHQFIRVSLNRIFGFGNWDFGVDDVTCLADRSDPKGKHLVAYRLRGTLNVRFDDGTAATYVEYAAKQATHPLHDQAHDNAVKGAASYALRRCAINLGSVFGLGLYFADPQDSGRKSSYKGEIVRWTIAYPPPSEADRAHEDPNPTVDE